MCVCYTYLFKQGSDADSDGEQGGEANEIINEPGYHHHHLVIPIVIIMYRASELTNNKKN